jgi:hypothetical protein
MGNMSWSTTPDLGNIVFMSWVVFCSHLQAFGPRMFQELFVVGKTKSFGTNSRAKTSEKPSLSLKQHLSLLAPTRTHASADGAMKGIEKCMMDEKVVKGKSKGKRVRTKQVTMKYMNLPCRSKMQCNLDALWTSVSTQVAFGLKSMCS